jgi:trk system potassium uptake protein TrkA
MNIVVVGCGRMGAELAHRLFQEKHHVVIVDQNAAAFDNLHPDFRGRTIEGEALAQDVLSRAGIEQADGLAAVTNSDVINAVVGHIARTVYHIPKVVVRNYDARWQSLHEAFGSQTVSSTIWGAQRMEELLHGTDIRTIFSAGNGEVDMYELIIPEQWRGCDLTELLPDSQEYLVVAITHSGRAMLPTPDICLDAGDVVHLSATLPGIKVVRQRLDSIRES